MHVKTIFVLALAGLAFASCKRCADCVCENSIQFTFGPDVSEQKQQEIRDANTSALNKQYPETNTEVCETGRNDFDDAKGDFEGQSYSEDFDNPGATDYSYDFNHVCTCTDQ